MRLTVVVLHLVILAIGLAHAEDFMCPTCAAAGPNAQEDCESHLSYPVCELDQNQCIVYKNTHGFFTRACATESVYQQEFKKCKAQAVVKKCKAQAGGGCEMGRCFTSGCWELHLDD